MKINGVSGISWRINGMAAASKYQRMHQAKIMASYNGVNKKAFNESWQWRNEENMASFM
jgi:hypothetical protein